MMNRAMIGIVALTVAATPSLYAKAQCDFHWTGKFAAPGVGDNVYAMAVFDDGSGPALFVGGEFPTAGELHVRYVARWDGSSWKSVGDGLNGTVWALAVFDAADGSGPALYAGGDFTMAGGAPAKYVARWDGHTWSALDEAVASLNGGVYALAVHDDGSGSALYVGGWFTSAGALPAQYIAKWNGAGWSTLNTGLNNAVLALASFDDDGPGPNAPALYAAGYFTRAGGLPADHIAKWDGSAWSTLGALDDYAYALVGFNDGTGPALYVGGRFTSADGVSADHVAQWKNGTWSPLGAGCDEAVAVLGVFEDYLIAGGWFTAAGAVISGHIARWDGATWSTVGGGVGNGSTPSVQALAVFDDDGTGPGTPGLYVGGDFFTADDLRANRIAKWDGAHWSVLGQGINNPVHALATLDADAGGPNPPGLCAGGSFTAAGGVAVDHVAIWDGAGWSWLGAGLNGAVRALVADNGTLYAGGDFTAVNSGATNHVAWWNGSAWLPLGDGLEGRVFALAILGGVLYAGSDSSPYVSAWDGTTWTDVGGGLDGPVWTLTVLDGALYAGGGFTRSGTVSVEHVAMLNGSSWLPLGEGTDGDVWALAVAGPSRGGTPALYAGGRFTLAGGDAASHIAMWDGTTWSALGGGLGGGEDPCVYALAIHDMGNGPALIAGGSFTTAEGQPAERIAQWDGLRWTGTDAGPNETVSALLVFDDGSGPDLYAGGWFTAAGGQAAHYIAEWLATPPRIVAWPQPWTVCEAGAAQFSVDARGTGQLQYQWRKDGLVLPGMTDPTLDFVVVSLADEGVYDVVVSDDCGRMTSNGVALTIHPLPVAAANSNSPIRVGQTLRLTGGPDGMAVYAWTGPDGFSSSEQNPTLPNVTTADAGTYTLSVTDVNECRAGITTVVSISPAVCRGDCNCDGAVNFADINPFIAALVHPNAACSFENCDVNGDGVVNFADINPFVASLNPGGPCPP